MPNVSDIKSVRCTFTDSKGEIFEIVVEPPERVKIEVKNELFDNTKASNHLKEYERGATEVSIWIDGPRGE